MLALAVPPTFREFHRRSSQATGLASLVSLFLYCQPQFRSLRGAYPGPCSAAPPRSSSPRAGEHDAIVRRSPHRAASSGWGCRVDPYLTRSCLRFISPYCLSGRGGRDRNRRGSARWRLGAGARHFDLAHQPSNAPHQARPSSSLRAFSFSLSLCRISLLGRHTLRGQRDQLASPKRKSGAASAARPGRRSPAAAGRRGRHRRNGRRPAGAPPVEADLVLGGPWRRAARARASSCDALAGRRRPAPRVDQLVKSRDARIFGA